MKGWDPEGQLGPRKPLPDSVQILEPPLDKIVAEPTSEQREPAVVAAPAVAIVVVVRDARIVSRAREHPCPEREPDDSVSHSVRIAQNA